VTSLDSEERSKSPIFPRLCLEGGELSGLRKKVSKHKQAPAGINFSAKMEKNCIAIAPALIDFLGSAQHLIYHQIPLWKVWDSRLLADCPDRDIRSPVLPTQSRTDKY